MHPLVVVADRDSRGREGVMPRRDQPPGLLRFIFSPRCVWLAGVKRHGMYVEQVTDKHDTIRRPLLLEVLAERMIPRMGSRFVNVADDEDAGHGSSGSTGVGSYAIALRASAAWIMPLA